LVAATITSENQVTALDDRLAAALPDRYAIERQLGIGGMATVYLAQDRKHHRSVAVKVLHPEFSHLLGRTRFLREIEIAATLAHPGIVPLFDSGLTDDVAYYVMPYVAGESLRDRLARETQLPLADALRIAREVGDALAHAHGHGIVHRDIKPGNILLGAGHAMLADFGIARAITEAGGTVITSSGLAVGTPPYMSPEQATGRDAVDARSDVYGLGCVVFEMLAGQPPFVAATAQAVLAMHRSERPPTLEIVRPGVGHAVQQVVEQALAKAPADRWQTVTAFVEALERAAAAPESAEFAPTRARAVPRWRRWRVAVGVVAVALVAGLTPVLGPLLFPPSLDGNKIVVFPLQARGDSSVRADGVAIASLINSALETAEPLRAVDGWTWLTPEQRRDPTRISAADVVRIARAQHARYALGGWVLRSGDSGSVTVALQDVRGDSTLPQVSQAGLFSPSFIPELGLRAVNGLLSRFLAPGRRLDAALLQGRNPAAVVAAVRGDLAYRDAKFDAAMAHYQRALTLDSQLVLAALKGAQAASWRHEVDSGLALVNLALRHLGLLPPKYGQFAVGLRAYLRDDPDSAAAAFGRAIALDPGWTEAHMALGEVRYHFVFGGYAPDSLAEVEFEQARRLDPGFAPALYHLFQIAIRRGWSPRADSLSRALRAAGPDPNWVRQVVWVAQCRRHGPDAVDWVRAAHGPGDASFDVVMAGHTLAGAGADLPCAERAFRVALREAPPESLANRWDALVGLQAVLIAQGRNREVRRLLDWAADSLTRSTRTLQLVGTLAGVGTDSGAFAGILANGGEQADLRGKGPRWMWWYGLWAWHRRDAARLEQLVAVLSDSMRAGSPDGSDTLVFMALSAKLALLRADTTRALALLAALQPRGTMGAFGWQFMGTLPGERLLLAQLLLAQGRYARALEVAGVFDSSQPIAYAMYLPASLAVRLRAAERLGRGDLVARFRERLRTIGRRDLL
jgi:serine/threonine protein kinase/tetratricopeptide (TPR) repeat protein